MKLHRILILGGGFGGVYTARRLDQILGHRDDVAITLLLFRSQVEIKFKAGQGNTVFYRQARNHQPGLLKSLAADAARAHLQGQLSEVSYQNWFAFTRQLEEASFSTTIAVQDETTAEYLQSEYGPAIKCAAAYLGEPVRFIWRVEQ
jgi:hypothetical protein